MGGAGAGHKSERARRSRLENIQKARAARRRAPLPWRSGLESRVIEQLVWQWFLEAGEKSSYKRPFDSAPGQPWGLSAQASGERKTIRTKAAWSKLRVARFLGVSHTWVNKLVKRFEADPERMRRKMRAFAPASFEKLERAREETERQRERGWLRGPIRWRRVKVTLEGRKRRVAGPTRAEMKRREALRQASFGPAQDKQDQRCGLSAQDSAMRLPYREMPAWARGLLLPGDAGMMAGNGPFARTPVKGGTPRPVPFAFRRRR